ncbi:MAG: hypothetical protein QM784_05470 [Polyangiaceae bacterium]
MASVSALALFACADEEQIAASTSAMVRPECAGFCDEAISCGKVEKGQRDDCLNECENQCVILEAQAAEAAVAPDETDSWQPPGQQFPAGPDETDSWQTPGQQFPAQPFEPKSVIESSLRTYKDLACSELAGYQPGWVVASSGSNLYPENYRTPPATTRRSNCPSAAKSDALTCTSTMTRTKGEHLALSVECSREDAAAKLWDCRCIEDGKTTKRVSGAFSTSDPGFVELCWDAPQLACFSGASAFCVDD